MPDEMNGTDGTSTSNETESPNPTNDTTNAANEGESGAPSESGSFKGNLADAAAASIAPTQKSSEEGEKATNDTEREWWLTPDIKGEGEKPEWHNNKQFKSILDEAKSAQDMRKKLGSFTGAPEKYEIKLGEDNKVEIDTEDALFKDFTTIAHDGNMSEEMYNKCLNMFVSYTSLQDGKQDEKLEEFQAMELEKMGGAKEAGEKIQEMCQWYKQNFPNVKEETVQNLKDMMYFSEAYDIFRGMRDKMGYVKVPTGAQVEVGKSKVELQKMITDPKYLSDPVYQEMVNTEYNKKLGK